MIRIADFFDSEGRVKWSEYTAAQVEAGDICAVCHDWKFKVARFVVPTGRFVCADCSALKGNEGEITHDHFLRCPHCKNKIDVMALVQRDPEYGSKCLTEGGHDIACPACDRDFTFETACSYTFRSPPLDEPETVATKETVSP